MMEWWSLLPLVVAILGILGIGVKTGRWIGEVSARFNRVEERLKNVESSVGLLLFIHIEELFKLYRQYFPSHQSNPSEKEKERLLDKLRAVVITSEEAKKLKPLLEKQRSEALASGLTGAVVVIGGLLLLLAIISALAGGEGGRE